MDTPKRTLTKAVIWNHIGLSVMSVVGFIATGAWTIGGSLAVANAALGLTMYVGYERVWNRISSGRTAHA